MSRVLTRAIAAALLLALAQGCGGSGSQEASAPAGPNSAALAALQDPGILERMAVAPFTSEYIGRRRVELVLPSPDGTSWSFVMEERVASDGHGRFSVDPIAVSEPPMSDSVFESFQLVQKARQGFVYRYRDFRVRDLSLATQTWNVRDVGDKRTVAGIDCVELELTRQRGSGSSYIASVDPRTGLVLAWTELGPASELRSRVEFVEVSYSPAPSDVEWSAGEPAGRVLDAGADESQAVGFEPARPRLLPAGYRPLESRWTDEGGVRFVRRDYGDGVENLFFLHGRPLDTSAPTAGPAIVPAPSTPESGAAVVRVHEFGAWTIAEHKRANGELLVVIGKVGEADVLRTLQSAL